MEDSPQTQQDKILEFLVKNRNLVLIAIVIFGFYLRYRYLNINAAVWWDEGEYLSIAKEWAYGINYLVSPIRQPLIPLFISVFYKIGISSLSVIKFFVVLLPSVAVIFYTYLLGKELYNKNIGLISAFIMSVFWIPLFWTTRISTDMMGLLFSLIAFIYFYKGYVKKEKPKLYLSIVGIALALGFTTRVGNVLTILVIAAFLLIIARSQIYKLKSIRYLIIFSIVIVTPYLIWNQVKFGNIIAFWGVYARSVNPTTTPIFWSFFRFFKLYLFNTFFAFFIIGLLSFYKLFLGFDILLKRKDPKLLADFFTLLIILIPTFYFAFILRQTSTEPRWAMVMAPAMFLVIAKGFIFLYDLLIKYIPKFEYKKLLSMLAVVAIILSGSLAELEQADSLIKAKKDTYVQLKDAGLWIKENSNEDDIIFSSAIPQNSYYSERRTMTVNGPEEPFNKLVEEFKPKFLVLTILEGYPEWAWSWPERHQDLVVPVNAYFADAENTQPILIIYEFINHTFPESDTVTDVNTSVEEGQ